MSRPRDDNDEPTGRDLDALVAEEPDPEDLPPVEGEDEDVDEEAADEEETAEASPDEEDDAESDLEAAFAEEADPEAVAEEPAPPKEPAKPSKSEPFKPIRLRVDGQDIELAASREGIYEGRRVRIVEEADWNLLHSRLRDPATLRRQQQQHQKELEARDPRRNPVTIRATTYLEELNKFLVPLIEKGDTAPLQDWLENAQINSMRMQMLADQRVQELGQQVQKQAESEAELERRAQEWVPRLERALDTGISQILAQPEYRGLGLNAAALRQTFWDIRSELFFEADEDDAATYGVEVGSLMMNNQRLQQLIEPARQAAAAVTRKDPAARRQKLNAAAAGKTPAAKTAAPVVRRAGSSAAAAVTTEKKKFANKQEWEAHLYKDAR